MYNKIIFITYYITFIKLELGLAEDILKNYDEIQIGIKRSR